MSQDVSERILIGRPKPTYSFIPGRTKAFEDTSFVTGDSPAVLDVNNALGRNAHGGWLINDGAGNILVEFSDDAATYGDQHTSQAGDIWNLNGLDINRIRLTWVTDSAYRILVV